MLRNAVARREDDAEHQQAYHDARHGGNLQSPKTDAEQLAATITAAIKGEPSRLDPSIAEASKREAERLVTDLATARKN